MAASSTRLVNKSLKHKLIELIRLRGPMTVPEYMKIVLLNPESGFYMNQDVFGVKGHFTTNPEISQSFGEMLGAWIYQEWTRFGRPRPLRLTEFGPGRGTLMQDITRTLSKFERHEPQSIEVRLIEISPKMRNLQSDLLTSPKTKQPVVKQVEWFTHIDSIDKNKDDCGFDAYIAHEYFDALPIHKFVRDPKTARWRELLIDYDKNHELRFCISRNPSLSTRLLVPEGFQGNHIEVCAEGALQLERVADRLNANGKGLMLICDYGFEASSNQGDERQPNRDTFRSFNSHESWPPLKNPGEADLTADVDFGYLKKHISDKTVIFGSVRQKDFLLRCGLQARLEVILREANDEDKEEILSSFNMMINEMGERYRFMSMFPKTSEPLFIGDPPAGFKE